MIKKKIVSLISMFFIILLLNQTANATLIEENLIVENDGLVTMDTVSGLEWLDLSLTVNFTLQQVLDNYSSQGFQLATDSQVSNLYVNAGLETIVTDTFSTDTNIINATNSLLSLLGSTQNYANGMTGLLAYHLTGGQFNNAMSNLFVSPLGRMFSIPTPPFIIETTIPTAFGGVSCCGGSGSASPDIGYFLTRELTTVPEPSTYLLLGSGLFGLVFYRRKEAQA